MDDDDETPDDLSLDATPFSLDFHGSRNALAVGLVTGEVCVHDLAAAEVRRFPAGSGSCRVVAWHHDTVLTGYESGAVVAWDVARGARVSHKKLDGAASACLASETAYCVGDDLGNVYVWDARAGDMLRAKPHEDFVSGIAAHDGLILACAADGRLSVLEPRRNLDRVSTSDPQDDELLSIQVIKGGRKVVCGTQTGALVIWSWGRWGDSSDRALGHPESVDAMLKVDEDILCTGSSDGLLRVVRVQPGLHLLGVLGDHDGFPIERLASNHDLSLVASLSHDTVVRFWDARELNTLGADDHATDMAPAAPHHQQRANVDTDDLPDDDDSDWDTDDDTDMDNPTRHVPPQQRQKQKQQQQQQRRRLKTKTEQFFDGLA
ncbi:hypothetical protein CTAYLR_001805 [Chrysophaeum taylorii]|uniref:Uncharacterized protein n=1 Tax=Chrysophaeum taylorii TaxID=2483200 RepID=A0AAD7U842_9STRA|nr:hypothetical protein CTAYLR_001805 [Chrysophaeum taylorii]